MAIDSKTRASRELGSAPPHIRRYAGFMKPKNHEALHFITTILALGPLRGIWYITAAILPINLI